MADRDQNGRFLKGHAYGFKAGASGNPGGRPRDYRISEAIARELSVTGLLNISYAEEIARILVSMARDRDRGAIREVTDPLDGKPRQSIYMAVYDNDGRHRARQEGLSEADVIREARALIESYDAECGGESDPDETEPGGYKS